MGTQTDGPSEALPTVGVDVGGTKIAAARVADGRVEDAVELPTSVESVEAVIDGITRAISSVAGESGDVAAIGVGVPSQVDALSGRIVSSVNIPLADVQLGAVLRERFATPVFVDNDGNCATLAEAELAPAGPLRHLVMYTLGTGVGGGVVIEGRIYRGATGLGAELGHVVIDSHGPPCPGACPNHGCLEALCSGTALGRDARELAERRPDSRLGRIAASGERISALRVVEAARAGDSHSRALLERLGVWLGIGLAGAINTFEPQRIAVGGGLSDASDFFLETARREARARALPALAERVEIECAQAGPQAGVVGAALLARHEMSRASSGKLSVEGCSP